MEETNKKCFLGLATVISAIIIGGCLIAVAFLITDTFYKVKALNYSISVTGSAEKIVKSDTVKWTCSFSQTTAPELLKEGNAKMKADLEIILNKFTDGGIKEDSIAVQTLNISPVCLNSNNMIYDEFGNQTCSGNNLSGYTLQQSIIIESDKVDKISKLAKEAAGYFIDQGIIFESKNVEYYYNKLGDLKMDLISEATQNAQTRAEKIAESTGSQIGNLQSASTGVFQVTSVNSTEVSDYGYYDTSSIDKKVTAVVRTSFNLKK